MCEFISLVVPKGADTAALESLIERYKLGRALTGSTILNVEPRAKCHCGTWLGSLKAAPTASAPKEGEIARKRKAGWSQARIDRWLREKARSAEVKERDHHRRLASVGDRDSVGGWLPFIREALESKATSDLGLVVTWGLYWDWPHDFEYETTRLDELRPTTLLTMRHGVIHTFVAA